jgi:ribosomal protein S18 acetylase RimI-like enzyme
MYIYKVVRVSRELVSAFGRLIPQLTADHPPLTRAELSALLRSDSAILLAARHPGPRSVIAGLLSLTVYRVPTGIRSIIEDVVVDEDARGVGIGEALVRRALEIARLAGASGVTLTSNARRESANRLYQRIGFTRRETNAYIYKF